MASFEPALPPAGRLTRLAVVLDAQDPGSVRLAIFCDRAGIDAVWLRVRAEADGASDVDHRWEIAGLARARVGIWIDEEPDGEASDGEALDGEVPDGQAPDGQAPDELAVVGARLDVMATLGSSALSEPHTLRRGAIIHSLDDVAAAIGVADDIVLAAWLFADLETAADDVRVRAREAGRDPATLGVAALLPVSIGRTQAEARARIGADPAFSARGDPADIGICGTLEECQDRAIALAHAGITDLRCLLPHAPDVHDVIAQLTAMTLGTTDVLVPGSLRSPAPPPPEGWGGRPPAPTRRWVSDGSRRG